MTYEDDREWAKRYDDRLQMIAMKAIGLSQLASVTDDQLRATDFQFIWQSTEPRRPINIAGRVRRSVFRLRYPYDITFRYERKTGTKTEWQKIVNEGFGDFAVYAIALDDETDLLCSAAVINLELFRAHVHHRGTGDKGVIPNRDRQTSLRAWDLQYLAYCPDCLGVLRYQEGLEALDAPYLELMTRKDKTCQECGSDKAAAWGYPWFRWLCKSCKSSKQEA